MAGSHAVREAEKRILLADRRCGTGAAGAPRAVAFAPFLL